MLDLKTGIQDKMIRKPVLAAKVRVSMKNVVKLDNYYCPDELKEAVHQFAEYYNHQRYHESLESVTPADVY